MRMNYNYPFIASIILCNQIPCAENCTNVTLVRSIGRYLTSLSHNMFISRQLYLATQPDPHKPILGIVIIVHPRRYQFRVHPHPGSICRKWLEY